MIPLRMHLAFGIGGKSYVVLSGYRRHQRAGLRRGVDASERGFLVNRVAIPRHPHQQLIDQLL